MFLPFGAVAMHDKGLGLAVQVCSPSLLSFETDGFNNLTPLIFL
jgi:hypothetical protein